MRGLVLDRIDLNILGTLSRDCRTSYRCVGSLVGITSKSVKSRVKSMLRHGIIQKFLVIVNPAGFGYRTVRVIVRTTNEITKDDVIAYVKQFGDITHYAHHTGKTSMIALIIKNSLDKKTIQSLNDSLKPATVSSIVVDELPVSTNLSKTDLRIIKCLLLSDARIQISEIAKELDISEKTTTRRLDRMKVGGILDFSLQCDTASMIGYIQFAIRISVERYYHRDVYEHMYLEFKGRILYCPRIVDPSDLLTFIFVAENVFMIDFILAKVDSLKGVKNTNLYILTKLQFYNDWIIREIDEIITTTTNLAYIRKK